MSDFFVKYLPVDGPLKVGMALKPGFYHGTNKEYFEPEYREYLDADEIEGLSPDRLAATKMMQLFLCSMDIHIGDNIVWFPQPDEGCEQCCPTLIKNFQDANDVVQSHTSGLSQGYKIVGKISPEAIWVDDGDILTEDQIFRKFAPDVWPTGIVSIKCPTCKIFH